MNCPICEGESDYSLTKEGYPYFECRSCQFLFHRSEMSQNKAILPAYESDYWKMERIEALRREREDCFMRALELLYLSTIKVERILDFGCGIGVTVQLLREELELEAVGVDPFGQFEERDFLHRESLRELRRIYPREHFDAIYSIEVFEHLENPRETMADLVHFLRPGGKILINTGTREFIARCDPEKTYIDPSRRGHISIYSLKGFGALASPFGLRARFFAERKYAVILEPSEEPSPPFPLSENLEALRRIGDWFPLLFQEYMRLVDLEEEFEAKSRWALELSKESDAQRENIVSLRDNVAELRDNIAKLLDCIAEREGELARLHSVLVSPRLMVKYWLALWRRRRARMLGNATTLI